MHTLIRSAQATDREPARQLARRALAEFGLTADFEGIDVAIGRLGDSQGQNLVEIVCEHNACFAGCLAMHALDAGSVKLAGFYIDPPLRGQGLGRRMLLSAIAHVQQLGMRRLHLETMKSMTAAVHLYQSLGWRHVADLDPASGVDTAFVLEL